MRVLVTGAAGKLGSATVKALLRAGHTVRATDQRYQGDLGVPFLPADLRDEHALYPLCEGMEALVHLGNHPNRFAGPSPQRLLAENVAMNANAFNAAVELGVRTVVFASSVQVMVATEHTEADPHILPYLPLDGSAPHAHTLNPYALSKRFAEETLAELARQRPELSVTALRFPMLVGEWFRKRLASAGGRVPREFLHLWEATAHLPVDEGAALVVRVVERARPGYTQLFPAQTIEVTNVPVPELVRRFYSGVRLTRPLSELDALVDTRAIAEDFAWRPGPGPRVELAGA
jgi:UDP-glucose 4-epimerase